MTEVNNKEYDQIIDYLDETLDVDQKRAFEQWLNKSEVNLILFEKIKGYWMNNNPTKTITPSIPWEKWIFTVKYRQNPNFRKLSLTWAVAASLILLVSLSWFLINSRTVRVIFATEAHSFWKDTLEDGSIVYLYPSSSIEMEPNKMKVTLKGEAYFVISPKGSKHFTVNAGNASIIVKGTSFLVNTKAKVGEISVQVESGMIELWDFQKKRTPLIVEAGEQGYYSSQNNSSWKIPNEESIYLIYQPKENRYNPNDN